MKKYTSRATKPLANVTLSCAVISAVGVILAFVDFSVGFGFALLGGMTSVILLAVFLAEKSRYLVIDSEKIIFPRGVEKNGERLLRKTVIRFEEVMYVKSTFHKGDVILTGDCFFHTLTLKDGSKVTVTLYAYGKEAETEIIETILKKTTQS